MEDTNWGVTFDEFLEIVDSFETNEFAVAPPMEGNVQTYPIVLNGQKQKTRLSQSESPTASPNSRINISVRDLTARLEILEESVNGQCQRLFDLFSYINSRLDNLEKIVIKKSNVAK
jgi:hypothetical protein